MNRATDCELTSCRKPFVLVLACLLCPVGVGVVAASDVALIPGAAEPSTNASIYGQGVRATPWQTPEDERLGFHLPPDFEVRLFASEPQITKPLNLAFDDRGRLWLTQSVEYPYPAADPSAASDAVMILNDTDGDGHADQVTRFADRLNIPIGILPYGDGCLCFSIPDILYLRDTDGDGICDRREKILGPFDTSRDTHGMINALRMGNDGWVYACHGFNNQSEVTGSDGHTVKLSSGNTFRFRPDGSRIEVVTHGQVNPFGMTTDHWGFRYSADCHSKPITQLIRGACYPSFGRPHDGLGFLPPMVDHLHGSTAICGIVHIPPESPIVPLRNQMLSGNVMTSRLNRNLVVYQGATATGRELADFMTSDDPWFRPVDIRLGPDGHLYVADFYNKIIGHYEVPLDHPGRDRKSGRIWQIRYVGKESASAADTRANLPVTERPAIDRLRSANRALRWTAIRKSVSIADQLESLMRDHDQPPHARVAAMTAAWLDGRLGERDLTQLASDPAPRVRVEALRLSGELPQISEEIHQQIILALQADDARVIQAAAEALGRVGDDDDVEHLFETLARVAPDDPVLRQTIRIAIRDLYRASDPDSKIWHRTADAEFASIMLGLQRREMIDGLLDHLSQHPDSENRDQLLMHAARHATESSLARCVELAKASSDQIDRQFQLLSVLAESQNARTGHVPGSIGDWARQLVNSELDRFEQLADDKELVGWQTEDGTPWPLRERKLTDGQSHLLVDSIERGEQYTGVFTSDPFTAPSEISFWLAGHNGVPGKPDQRKNRVRLVEAGDGTLIYEAFPPRNDVARLVRWDTSAIKGQQVRIECVDGDAGNAYAWLAIGNFQPSWILGLEPARALERACRWVSRLGLTSMEDRLRGYLQADSLSRSLRIEVADAVASLQNRPAAAVLLQFLRGSRMGEDLDRQVISACIDGTEDNLLQAAKSLTRDLTSAEQRAFALGWVQRGADVESLLRITREGWLAAGSLADPEVMQTLTPRLTSSQREQLESLTANIDANSDQRQRLAQLLQSLPTENLDLKNGHQIFKKNCAACHQLRGEGVVVGPQLDGAAVRSPERLLEDIVTPDHNVDRAFRTTSFLLEDGRVQVGLVQNETEQQITLVDSAGKQITLDADAIERRQAAGRSLMPGNFGELISAKEFADMLAYIRGQ